MVGALIAGAAVVWSHRQVTLCEQAAADSAQTRTARRVALEDATARLVALRTQLFEVQRGNRIPASYEEWGRQQSEARASIVRLRERIAEIEPDPASTVPALPTMIEASAKARTLSGTLLTDWMEFERRGSGLTEISRELAARQLMPLVADELTPTLATLTAFERADAEHIAATLGLHTVNARHLRLAFLVGLLAALGVFVSALLRRGERRPPVPKDLVLAAAAKVAANPTPAPIAAPAPSRAVAAAPPPAALIKPSPTAATAPAAIAKPAPAPAPVVVAKPALAPAPKPSTPTRSPIPKPAPAAPAAPIVVSAAAVDDFKRKAADSAPGIPVVLVADSIASDGEILALLLKSAGYAVICCEDAPKALAAITAIQFNLLILSQRLPGASGLEILREGRRSHPDLPALFLTSTDEESATVKASGQTVADVIRKPVSPRHLLWSVSEIFHPGENRVSRDYTVPEPDPDEIEADKAALQNAMDLTVPPMPAAITPKAEPAPTPKPRPAIAEPGATPAPAVVRKPLPRREAPPPPTAAPTLTTPPFPLPAPVFAPPPAPAPVATEPALVIRPRPIAPPPELVAPPVPTLSPAPAIQFATPVTPPEPIAAPAPLAVPEPETAPPSESASPLPDATVAPRKKLVRRKITLPEETENS